MIGVAVSLVSALAVFVLPGFGLLSIGRLLGRLRSKGEREPILAEPRPPVEALVLAIAWSMIGLSLFGALLLGAEIFDYGILGAFTAVLALIGIPAFFSTVRKLRGKWLIAAALFLLSIPLVWTALRTNLTPTHSYQWYYWDLGRQLDIAGGVPHSVLEFGLAVRWHPDYVLAVIGTAAYHALTFPLTEVAAIGAYRVPVFLLGVGATYVVFRLWVSRAPALVGVAVASATTLYITKFDAYKPESLGLVAGLFATWLLVVGIRGRSRQMALLAGALFGVAVGMHGIAATVTGMLAACAAVAETWHLAPAHRRATVANLARAAVLAVVVVLATGLSLQGRAVVASDAGHPVLEHGHDPTWAFLNRHNGIFYFPPQPTVGSQASDTLEHPWPGGLVGSWGWAFGSAVVLAAAFLSLRTGGRRRQGAAALLGTTVLIALAMVFFSVKFDTFIPQHTGLTRIAIYLGLLYGLGMALAADLVLRRLRRRNLDRSQMFALGVASVVFFGAWAIGVSVISLNKYGGIGREGREALAVLKDQSGGPDQAVLSNISTRGLIEFTTGLEAPVEGRQPVIEDPEFLTGANKALVDIHHYFEHPTSPALPRRLGVRWLLVSNGSRGIGSPFDIGLPFGQAERLSSEPYLARVWKSHNLALFRVKGKVRQIEPVGPSEHLGGKVALAFLAIALAAWLLSSRFRRARAAISRPGRPAVRATGCRPGATPRQP
jgi:hypothetical protein